MHDNPAADWQALSEHYRSMYDEELLNLAADFDNLTDTAKEALRNELSNRGLPAPGTKPPIARKLAPAEPEDILGAVDSEGGVSLTRRFDEPEQEDLPKEFTWKTVLCECESREKAWQLSEMLRRAGIESWINKPGFPVDLTTPVIMVAADRLEDAIEVARQPIAQDIVEESAIEIPEYEAPRCPACHTEDPVLEPVINFA
jgi:hypothetical protein